MGAVYFVVIVFLCYLLDRTTTLTVQSLRTVRSSLRINELILSLFFLGFVTSIPEMFVGVIAAIDKVPELSLGNLLGSNIVVLSLMIGLTAALGDGMSICSTLRKKDFYLTLALTGSPVIFLLDGSLARWEGVALLGAFIFYCVHFYRNRTVYQDTQQENSSAMSAFTFKDAALFTFSIIALLGVSYILVKVVLLATAAWGVPIFIVGLFLIAIGTNIPEVGFVIEQASKKYRANKDIATGILLGNVVINTPIIGALALVHPFVIKDMDATLITVGFLALILLVLGHTMVSQNKLSRSEGILLVCIYGAFLWYSFTAV